MIKSFKDYFTPLEEAKAPKKITRDAFLYMAGGDAKFAQCSTCRDWIKGTNRCRIMGPDDEVTKTMSCGLYVQGEPMTKGVPLGMVTPKEAGLVNRDVRCENCAYGGSKCGLYVMLNKEMPETFDLEEKIESKACCNAQTPK